MTYHDWIVTVPPAQVNGTSTTSSGWHGHRRDGMATAASRAGGGVASACENY